jgi:rubredoxin
MRKSTFERRLSYECKACGTVAERLRPDRKCEKCGKLLWEALVEDQREGKETGGVRACGK